MSFKFAQPVLCAAMLALSGCGLIYKQDIEQGNVLEQATIDQLKPGMSRRQVALILGSPATLSPFHQERWEYVTSVKTGRSGALEVKNLTVHFEGDRLVRIEGDYKPGAAPAETEAEAEAAGGG